MTIVDWVLVGAVIAFAWAGWRQGFVVGALSFAGFLGGGIGAAFLLPSVVAERIPAEPIRAAVLAGGILVCALVGQGLCSLLGRHLREGMTWSPARLIDNGGGAALNVLALAVITWIIASALAYLPATSVTDQIRQSRSLVAMDSLIPDQVRDSFSRLRDAVGSTMAPRVFSGLAEVTGPDVPAPLPDSIRTRGVRQARVSVLRVTGLAPECNTRVTGSGFVYGRSLVMTNAHVVAGVDEVQVEGSAGTSLTATVVAFDPRLDIAVLRVPGLDLPALPMSTSSPRTGDEAAVLGYPGGGELTGTPARIRAVLQARGDDIYGRAGVDRQVVSFRGRVKPGNSGGPLLTLRGAVYGMVFGSPVAERGTGYAISAEQLLGVGRRGERASTAVDTGSCQTR